MWWKLKKSSAVSTGKKSVFRRVIVKLLRLIGIVFVLVIFGLVLRRWLLLRSDDANIISETQKSFDVLSKEKVLTEPSAENVDSMGVLSSENYRVGQIVLGGDVGLLSPGDEYAELLIDEIRGEALGSKDQDEGRALITWKTSKMTISTLRYSKTSGGSEKVFEEEGFGMLHSVVLSNLDLSSSYLYTITARDRYGNEKISEAHAVYTGSKTVSLFELIVGALQDVFGWAVKR